MLLAVIFPVKSSLSHCLLLFRDKEISVHVFVINADLAKAVRAQNIFTSSDFMQKLQQRKKK